MDSQPQIYLQRPLSPELGDDIYRYEMGDDIYRYEMVYTITSWYISSLIHKRVPSLYTQEGAITYTQEGVCVCMYDLKKDLCLR